LNIISNIVTNITPNWGNKTKNITITEISNMWTLVDNAAISLSNIEVLYNQASNEKLKDLLKDIRDNSTTKMIDEISSILRESKVEPPSGFRRRDMSNENLQKNDAMLTDAEIAVTVEAALIGALSYINSSMVQASNSNIATMYLKCYNEVAQYLAKLMDLSKEGSWVNVPPTLNNVKQ
jgi:hypothetical protein